MKYGLCLIAPLLLLSVSGFGQIASSSCENIQEKLQNLTFSSSDSGAKIAELFHIGDTCIKELAGALKNDDFQISRKAWLIMMYLNNKADLKKLDDWRQKSHGGFFYLGPIPRFLPKSKQKLTFRESGDLAERVADKIFVDRNFRKFRSEKDIKSRLLGFNGAGNKALIEIDIAEQTTYHVILVKRKTGWHPLMIILVNNE